MVMDT